MEVETSNELIERQRRTIVELLLSDHPNDCMVCEKAGDCTLQELAYFYNVRSNRFSGERRQYTKKDLNPFIERDMEKCILCGKCVRVCDEIQGLGAIDISGRGFTAKVTPAFEKDLDCEFCGQCVSICPTGALMGKQSLGKGRQMDVKEVESICSYCGCGCNLTLHVSRNEVVRVDLAPGHDQRRLALRQGKVRTDLHHQSRPAEDAAYQKGRRVRRGLLGRGVRPHR